MPENCVFSCVSSSFVYYDKWHVPVEGSRKIAKLTFIFNSALMWRQMQKTLALHCFTKSTTCSACSGVKLFLRPQFLHWVCATPTENEMCLLRVREMVAKLTFNFNSALTWRQMQKTLALQCLTKWTTCVACSGVKLFLCPQFLYLACATPTCRQNNWPWHSVAQAKYV